jgi:hypothetical protein
LLLSGLRRLLVLFVALFALTSAASLAIGALAHGGLEHALAVGFYSVGAAILVGSLILGMRGPLRADWGEEDQGAAMPSMRGAFMPRLIRRTTPDERIDARRTSLALFFVGLVLILIGAGFDPTRNAF